jgi:8-oxo-dGTP pyrophosphatase MutT (NUDIX family)
MYAQSAVIPFKRDGEEILVLLITSRRSGRWVLPKGVIETNMSPAASAAKEALEEAGVIGEVDERVSLGTYTYEKWGGTCSVEVFGMRVTEELTDWPEAHTRIRRWMTIDEAKRKVKEADLQAILRRFEGKT